MFCREEGSRSSRFSFAGMQRGREVTRRVPPYGGASPGNRTRAFYFASGSTPCRVAGPGISRPKRSGGACTCTPPLPYACDRPLHLYNPPPAAAARRSTPTTRCPTRTPSRCTVTSPRRHGRRLVGPVQRGVERVQRLLGRVQRDVVPLQRLADAKVAFLDASAERCSGTTARCIDPTRR